MKELTQIFQGLLGMASLIVTALIAIGRLAWRAIRKKWMSCSKWLRRLIATVFIISPLSIVAIIGYSYYDYEYGRNYGDERLSDDVTLRSFSDGRWRVFNYKTQSYTTPRVSWVSEVSENDSLVVYALPGKRGYINVNTGRVVIDAKQNNYRRAWVFSEGIAAVMQGDKIGFINAQNQVVIPFQFDCSRGFPYDFSYVFHGGYCVMTNADGKMGLINRKGEWVLEPTYDEVKDADERGYRIIALDGKYGVINAECEVVYAPEYEYVEIVADGFVLYNDGQEWQVDFEGNMLKSFMFSSTYYLKYPIGYDECGDVLYEFADYLKYEVLGNYGIMDRISGKPITPAIYSDINMLSKELFEVQCSDSYEWYLVNAKGEIIMK